jgi:hypothetical protein
MLFLVIPEVKLVKKSNIPGKREEEDSLMPAKSKPATKM